MRWVYSVWVFWSFLFGNAVYSSDIPSIKPDELARIPSRTPEREFYRRLFLNIPREGNFSLELPGFGKSTEIQYKFDWNSPLLDLTKLDLKGSEKSMHRIWEDRVMTVRNASWLTIEGLSQGKLPITCVYVFGQDTLNPKGKPNDFPRFILKVQLVINDNDCKGPVETKPDVYVTNTDLWETALTFQLRGDGATNLMYPIEPKLRYLRNEFFLIWENK